MAWYDNRTKEWRFSYTDPITGKRRTDGAPSKQLAKLAEAAHKDREFKVKHGLIPAESSRHGEMAKVDLTEHVAAYAKHLRNDGRSEKHVRTVELRLPKLFGMGNLLRLADIGHTSIVAALAKYAESGVSQETVRAGFRQTRSFLNWCVNDNRIPSNPINRMKPPVVTEQRRPRRAATADEAARILAAAADAKWTHWKPADRSALLCLYLGTGFRRGDCLELVPESFQLAGSAPTVSVAAKSSKNRKGVVQPISVELAEGLKKWLVGKPKGRKVFPALTDKSRVAAMVKRLCKKAGVPFVTREGRIDGHSLRHTYGTRLGEKNDIRTVQELLRHADIKTTQKYMHTDDAKKRSAVEGLPNMNWGE